MKYSLQLKLEKLIDRQEELEGLLSDPDVINNQNKFRELSQEYSEIKPIVICFNNYLGINKNIENWLKSFTRILIKEVRKLRISLKLFPKPMKF